jgi:hypothetical protein
MLVIPYRMGYRVTDIPIEYRERIGASTLQRFKSTVWTFKRLWRARKVPRPGSRVPPSGVIKHPGPGTRGPGQ